jgi:carbon-monoxide dehydrogenase large subunit
LNNRELASGAGTFVNDVQLPNMAYLAILRSSQAHAHIVRIDTSQAEALEGVLYVMTGRQAIEAFNPIPEGWNTREVGAKHVDWYPLVPERVRYVGEAVAAVVAESKYIAQLAVGLIDVDYEALEVISDAEMALADGAPLVEPSWGDNLLTTRDWITGDPDEAFRSADHVVSGRVRSERVTGV